MEDPPLKTEGGALAETSTPYRRAQKNFLQRFARVSPGFVAHALGIAGGVTLFFSLTLPASVLGSGTQNKAARREAASTQYTHAEELRAALSSKPADKRSLAEYKQVVASYRRVYLITPHATEVPDALLAAAELYTEMGDRFGRSYYQLAVDSYQFLLHEYPTSHFGQDALLRVAKLQRDQLGDAAQASKTYQEFLKKYPRSARRREVQEALAELALLQNPEPPAPSASASDSTEAARDAATAESSRTVPPEAVQALPERKGAAPRIRAINTSAAADSTRVTIDLEELVQYSSARIRNPDRIFFDLHAAQLTKELARQNIRVEGNLLTAVRVAQNHSGVVRVVLDVTGVKDYTASLLTNPPQLIIDLYPNSRADQVRAAAKTKRKQAPSQVGEVRADPAAVPGDAPPPVATVATNTDINGADSPAAEKPIYGPRAPVYGPPAPESAIASQRSATSEAPAGLSGAKASDKARAAKSLKARAGKPDLIRPVAAAQPTRDGQATLTRTLGLKISRIVIDPGHGGHDTGTIGPTGLMEKDLCLDVALRLGKIIQQRLPGAEVVYTRSDDTFIPLEERTRIANESKADLFISIHANSSRDHGARGVETYYLNLKGSPDAMEVAARENATAQESIHDLEDMVKKIAQSEKIDESREFASDIQESLARRVQQINKTVKDRGVRKAPFVVLIGADMPSILTEISFLSNPADERILKKPEQRQKVAEGLYQGVASYLQSLNSMTLNMPARGGESNTPAGSVEQSRNQR